MTMFQRLSPALSAFFLACLAMSVIYALLGQVKGQTVLPDSYGGLVYALPAVAWAAIQGGLSLGAVYGCVFLRPMIAALSGFALGGLFVLFAVAAIYGGAHEMTLVAMAWPSAALCWTAAGVAWGARNGAG